VANNDLLKRLGIAHPIIQAPMGGGFTPPALVAACSNAGALGSLGAPYMSGAQITEAAAAIRKLDSKPFNINVFAGGYAAKNDIDPAPMLALLAEIHASYGMPPPSLPPLPSSPLAEQIDAVLQARPAVFSFAFGIPPSDSLARMKTLGIVLLGTATTVEEGRLLEAAGVDAVVAQGLEAGAHRGTFTVAFEDAMVPTLELVRGITAVVKIPVIASGGLMDGRDIVAALKAGAAAAQLGTAFMPCPEAGTPAAHKQALLDARKDTTVVTRAFSGRHARGLTNEYIQRFKGRENIILPFRLQNDLTRPMRTEAAKRGDVKNLSLWAGMGVARSRAMPAAELVKTLVTEMQST